VVVFLGVWLSLLAESWRENRVDAAAERAAIARLVRDLDFDVRDLEGNHNRAVAGFEAADWLLGHETLQDQNPDTVAQKLWPVLACSFFIENASEYTALKSSGRLGLIVDADLRQRVVELYESRSFMKWAHELDCNLTEGVKAAIVPHVILRPLVDIETTDRLTPRVSSVLNANALFRDPASRNKLIELTTVRRRLAAEIETAIHDATALADALRSTP
jgi:hypothetical protein